MVMIGSIDVIERETPPDISLLQETDRLFLNPALANDWRIRTDIRYRLERAAQTLPDGICLMIYEAFRSRARQRLLWDPTYARIKRENPEFTATQIHIETSRWVSPPDGFGSGHQAGAAIDITLCSLDRTPLDMGTKMQEFSPLTPTGAPVATDIRTKRRILITALASQSLVNYPDEWWHFCYGDRLWAEIINQPRAFFAPIA